MTNQGQIPEVQTAVCSGTTTTPTLQQRFNTSLSQWVETAPAARQNAFIVVQLSRV